MPVDPSAAPAVASAAAAERVRAWSEYWATGAAHSCAGSFEGNYGGAIRGFWEAVFAGLAERAAVLDLCCGNAPLARLLVDTRPLLREGGRIALVDAAAIAPPWLAAVPDALRDRIAVHARTDATALPFADGEFALAMSQYGIEYVGPPAVAELRRVLQPGAVFAAVLHHVQALPVRIAREELQHLAWLGDDQGLLDAAAGMVAPMARAATAEGRSALRDDAGANAARSRFNAAQAALDRRLEGARWPDVLLDAREGVAAVLQCARVDGQGVGEAALAALRRQLQALALRQQELVSHALDRAGVDALLQAFGDARAEVGVLEFEPGTIAGWTVQARRPAG